MKLKIGTVLHQVRIEKKMTLKELSTNFLSTSQLSHIENGESIPSTEKFIHLLSRLNIKYEEFIPLLEDDYLTTKNSLEDKLVDFANKNNQDGLKNLIQEAEDSYHTYNDLHFYHIKLLALSFLELIHSQSFESAREHLHPIKEYLLKIDSWNSYELSLFGNCIFVFDIEDVIFLGNRASSSIKKKSHIYQNRERYCATLNNLAIYILDYEEHYFTALEYANLSEELAYISGDVTRSLKAKIIQQVVYFKLQNGKYRRENVLDLVHTYDIMGWDKEYERTCTFIKKHGIDIEE